MKSKEANNGFKFICIQSATGPMIVPCKVERSRRLKRMRLHVEAGQYVLLKMPMRQAERHGIRFIQENGDWVSEMLAKQSRIPPLRTYLVQHPRISLSGKWFRVELGYRKGASRYTIDEEERTAVLSLNPERSLEDQMISLLRAIARKFLSTRVDYWSEQTGIRVHGVTVRDQKSRWGSCSETGAISLNWRLILLAPGLQDHVILHELAHLRHFDHSKSFHQFLNSLDPRSEQHARQLDGEVSRIISLGRVAS